MIGATMTETTTPPDFLEGIIVVHGAMRRDADRLPRALDAVTTVDGARALQRWFEKFAREVEHHHLREDDVTSSSRRWWCSTSRANFSNHRCRARAPSTVVTASRARGRRSASRRMAPCTTMMPSRKSGGVVVSVMVAPIID